MCFPGVCDGCEKQVDNRAWHCGYHLCKECMIEVESAQEDDE